MSAEIKIKNLGNFIAIWRTHFTSIEFNNKNASILYNVYYVLLYYNIKISANYKLKIKTK